MGSSYSVPDHPTKHLHEWVKSLPSMEGRTVAVTGTTTGMGFIAAREILRKGGNVILLNRPSERAQKALEQLQGNTTSGSCNAIDCDLQNFASVRDAAKAVENKASGGLDVLCNNAGIMAMRDTRTGDGFDQQMQTNHLSHFLLTSLLMPSLERAAGARGQARVVNHSSGARSHPKTPLTAKYLDKCDAGTLGGDGIGPRYERYHQTKLANVVFTEALQDRLDQRNSKVVATVAHPGLAASSLQASTSSDAGGMHGRMMNLLMRFAQSEEDGAMPLLQCICGKDTKARALYGPGGGGFLKKMMGDGVVGLPEQCKSEKLWTDEEAKKTLWEMSEKAVGPFFA